MSTVSVSVLTVAAVPLVAVTLMVKLPADPEPERLRPLATRDRITAVERSDFPRDSRLGVAPNSPELDWGPVFAPPLIINNCEGGNHHAVRVMFWDRVVSKTQQKTFLRLS
jgi:hypothetical protein